MKTRILLALLVLIALSVPAPAHHAFSAEFDGNKQVILKGNITKMSWINPHAWLYVDVKEADGKVTAWMFELGPPNALIKRGWNSNSVPVGLAVVVEGYRAKDGSNKANAREVTLADGKKLFAGTSNPDTKDPDQK